jgi:enoyl-CoA hydratase/carnithine racemase
MEERLTAAGGELLAEVRAGVATVTLNRPQALNALTYGMLEGLSRWLDAWEADERVQSIVLRGAGEKAFCAGGDIRALYERFTTGRDVFHFFEVEYALDYRIHHYPKPIEAVIDGIVMGGGMGLAQGARTRTVGARTRMAMPETAIGLFPDVGGSYFLSRAPGRVGIYLGLAGPTIRAADAIQAGLADRYEGDAPMAGGELEALRPAIDRHFAADSVEAIVASLRSERSPEHREWAARTLELLAKRSPTLLKVTLEQLRRGAGMSLADCFRMELGLIHACFEHGDFIEGIRALVVDKDNAPRWKAASLEAVDRAAVEAFFRPRWSASAHPLAHLDRPGLR